MHFPYRVLVTEKQSKCKVSFLRQRRESGASLVLFTLVVTFVLLPLMGLAIDVSILFWVKARLSAAVDSAALSAARSLNVGNTLESQIAHAQTVGQQYFAANFPPGVMGTTVFGGVPVPNSVSISITAPSNLITVTAHAQVIAPLYFLRMLRLSSGTVAASGQTTRRNANIILVLDRSGSMSNGATSCSALVAAVQSFTNQFVDGRDQIGMVTFSTTASVDYKPSYYFKSGSPSVNDVINSMVCVGSTSTAQALSLAYTEMTTVINQPAALNVILFFTDGKANTVVANYPIKRQADTRYDYQDPTRLVPTPASMCSATAQLDGGFTILSDSTSLTGYTAGVFSIPNPAPPISGGNPYPAPIYAPNCAFTRGGYGLYEGRVDVAYIPDTDDFGNSTKGFLAADTFPGGPPYGGYIRPDSPRAISDAAMNAADSRAQKIRADATYRIVIYTIGLAGNEPGPINEDFMERLANDPRASNYDSTQPQGLFALAKDGASLADAFNAVASQILRLSQ